jgi:hypothetical protein
MADTDQPQTPIQLRIAHLTEMLKCNQEYQDMIRASLQKIEEALSRNQQLNALARQLRTTRGYKKKHQRTRLMKGEKIPGCPYFIDAQEQVSRSLNFQLTQQRPPLNDEARKRKQTQELLTTRKWEEAEDEKLQETVMSQCSQVACERVFQGTSLAKLHLPYPFTSYYTCYSFLLTCPRGRGIRESTTFHNGYSRGNAPLSEIVRKHTVSRVHR